MVDETSLPEVVGILKQVEQELDDIVWRKNQAAVALRRGARLDERWATPKLRKADRVRLTEINADLAVVSGAFGGVSRARNRLERFHDWLMTEPGQAPLPFPKGPWPVTTQSTHGLRVRLERTVDTPCVTCGETVVVIGEGAGPHAASLRCAGCDRHRGWLPRTITNFLSETVRLFGVPDEPFLIRDASQTKLRGDRYETI